MENKHTPTPWIDIKACDYAGESWIEIEVPRSEKEIRDSIYKHTSQDVHALPGDMPYAIKCVNVHDDLAKVLKLSTNVLETMHAIEADDDARRMLGELIMANRAVLEKAGAA